MVEYKIEEFECISQHHAEMLRAKLNIVLVDDFYKYSKSQILREIKVDEKTAEQWFSVLELFKIPKMTPRYAELLYYCNINSIPELAHREASRIFYKLKKLDTETYLILLQYPTFSQIGEWIYYAKLMVKKSKYGSAIPLVLIPGFSVDQASDLGKFGIYTIEDFVYRKDMIKGLRRKILNMSRSDYREFLKYINLLRIDGINIYIANLLWEAGYTNYKMLRETDQNEIFYAIKKIHEEKEEENQTISLETVKTIQNKVKNMEEIE